MQARVKLFASRYNYVAVDSLVELHDALSRAERQGCLLMTETVNTLRAWGRHAMPHVASEPTEQTDKLPSPTPQPQARWFRRRRRDLSSSPAPAPMPSTDPEVVQRATALRQIGRDAEQMADRLEGLSAGYGLGLQRFERLLAECGIEPIDCVGKPVDAELMEVVQVVTESGQPNGIVVDEVRRGYRRGGQVYRFAQVVVAQMPSREAETPLTDDSHMEEEVD